MAILSGRSGSREPWRCLAVDTCLPTDNFANFVCMLRSADTPTYSPLHNRPNLAVFLGPFILVSMAVRAKSALSFGGASAMS